MYVFEAKMIGLSIQPRLGAEREEGRIYWGKVKWKVAIIAFCLENFVQELQLSNNLIVTTCNSLLYSNLNFVEPVEMHCFDPWFFLLF